MEPNPPQPPGRTGLLGAMSVEDKIDFCLLMSLLDIMLWGPQYWYTEALLFVVCLPGIVFRSVRYSPWLWWSVAAVIVHMIAVNWAWADNHKYVMTYWSIGVAMSLHVSREYRVSVLDTNARYILGLSMLFATFWKLISPEYTSGAFFEVLFLTDRRMDGTIALITDLSYGQLLENQTRVGLLRSGYVTWVNPESVQLHSSDMVKMLAFIATWWTVFIEGLKAVLFLTPSDRPLIFLLRDLTLVLFCFTTYIIAPVPGFGCTLCCLGMATCLTRGDGWFRLYQLGYMFVILCTVAAEPIREMIARM